MKRPLLGVLFLILLVSTGVGRAAPFGDTVAYQLSIALNGADDALEMVIGGATNGGEVGKPFVWELMGSSSQKQPWPMFHHDSRHTGLFPSPPTLSVSPDSIHPFYPPGSLQNPAQKLVYLPSSP